MLICAFNNIKKNNKKNEENEQKVNFDVFYFIFDMTWNERVFIVKSSNVLVTIATCSGKSLFFLRKTAAVTLFTESSNCDER